MFFIWILYRDSRQNIFKPKVLVAAGFSLRIKMKTQPKSCGYKRRIFEQPLPLIPKNLERRSHEILIEKPKVLVAAGFSLRIKMETQSKGCAYKRRIIEQPLPLIPKNLERRSHGILME